MKTEPIKDQAEFDQVWEYLVKTTMETLNVSRRTAELRINALRASGMLNKMGPPDEQPFQIGVDIAMRIPQLGIE